MKIDPEQSVYHEDPAARSNGEFTRQELKFCRFLLRRLRFLEAKVRETGGMADGGANGGAVMAEMEIDALEWVLTDVGFLSERRELQPAASE